MRKGRGDLEGGGSSSVEDLEGGGSSSGHGEQDREGEEAPEEEQWLC